MSVKIKLYPHVAVKRVQEFEANSVGEWLLSHYGESPIVNVKVFEGEPSEETLIEDDIAKLMQQSGEYTVLESVGEPVSTFIMAYGAWISMAITVVGAVVAYTMTPKGTMSNVNRTQQSPNNSLSNRENTVRYGERVEDIYGTVLAIPSLMSPTYFKYIDNLKYEYGYYCVGRGYYNITDLKDAGSLISAISGSSARIFDPFNSPNYGVVKQTVGAPTVWDEVVTAERSVEVDGITLKALNQIQIQDGHFIFNGGNITQYESQPNFASVLVNGEQLQVSGVNGLDLITATAIYNPPTTPQPITLDYGTALQADAWLTVPVAFDPPYQVGDTITIAGKFPTDSTTPPDVTTTVLAVSSSTLIKVSAPTATTGVVNYWQTTRVISGVDGTYTVSSFDDRLTTTNASFPYKVDTKKTTTQQNVSVKRIGVTEWTDWVYLNNSETTQVWSNFVAANGMFKDNGSKFTTSVTLEMRVEILDDNGFPTGSVGSSFKTLSGKTQDERAATLEYFLASSNKVRVRARRTTPYDYGFKGTVVDEVKWSDLYGVTPVPSQHFGNKTTVQTQTKATVRATAARSRQLNCKASRLVPTWNGTSFSATLNQDGSLASGTLNASSKMSDILFAISFDPMIGNKSVKDVDVSQIHATQQKIDSWNPLCGQFNYTFDSDNISYEESVLAIANAAFCIAYRQNGKLRVSFDDKNSSPTMIFSHKNKKPDSETITRRFSIEGDYEGVEIKYQDSVSNQQETITLPLGSSNVRAKKIEITGVVNYEQAWYRASREWEKLKAQRLSLQSTVTSDGRMLLPNSKVLVVDSTVFRSFDGEVVGQSGLEVTLSNDVEFETGVNHSIIFTKRDGTYQSVQCFQTTSRNVVRLAQYPNEAIVTSISGDGIRTIYSFAADDARQAQTWLVQELIVDEDDYVEVKAINYSPSFYSQDLITPPNRDIVLK